MIDHDGWTELHAQVYAETEVPLPAPPTHTPNVHEQNNWPVRVSSVTEQNADHNMYTNSLRAIYVPPVAPHTDPDPL